jgi:hypothetical protein
VKRKLQPELGKRKSPRASKSEVGQRNAKETLNLRRRISTEKKPELRTAKERGLPHKP